MRFEALLLDSLNRVFPGDQGPPGPECLRGRALAGETFSFHLALRCDQAIGALHIEVESPWPEHTQGREAELAVVRYPGYYFDPYHQCSTPGLYPDRLRETRTLRLHPGQWKLYRITLEMPRETAAGHYPIGVAMRYAGPTDDPPHVEIDERREFQLEVPDLVLPAEQPLDLTRWLHPSFIAAAGHCDVWSERHWELLHNYLANYRRHGGNMILTPLWAPDCAKLLEARADGRGQWHFDFARLERWIETCREAGIDRFEFSHIFDPIDRGTGRWRALTFGGREYFREDPAGYEAFFAALAPQLERFIGEHGLAEQVCFHISDEPRLDQVEEYRARRKFMDYFPSPHPVIDAMFDTVYPRSGLVDLPVPAIKNAADFQAETANPRWCYYFCGSHHRCPNVFMTMPLARVRAWGIFAWQAALDGFLHWGYNFWSNGDEYGESIDPAANADSGECFPAGDAFVVYPGEDGPLDSLRHEALLEGFQDLRLLRAAERKIGRAAALALTGLCDTADPDLHEFYAGASAYRELRDTLIAELLQGKEPK